ncbi:MAG: KAP P-loop domain protein [Petrotoga mobilis]|nr:MAG: KAP P-loop domain protein [Petrotoga mobilis]
MFKTDQPIESSEDDRLGRASFAQALGEAILSYKEKDSIVIGLFGAWGSGKTSIINMALEHIKSNPKLNSDYEKPIIVRFNPWNYSDQNQLITQFFKQLSVVLRGPDYSRAAKEVRKKLETYAKILEPFAVIPTVGPIARILSKTFKSAGSAIESWGNLKANDLNTIKTQINELLVKQNHKIIVVIDDIDRLNNTEIRQMFQLVKSLGDFKNTIYLLAFDKNVVINALKKVQEGSGSEYLEKVVQIPFEVPLISKDEVEHLLKREIKELVNGVPKDRYDQEYWWDIYHSGFKDFFRNIRDVTRYLNTLRFSFELIKDEVNVADFLAITAIQVFVPEVYYGIRDNKDLFTGVYYYYGSLNVGKEQAKKLCDDIISSVKDLPSEVLKTFLIKLFPKLEAIYGNNSYDKDLLRDWRKDCRICSPDKFDIFFRLSLPQWEIPQGEIEAILSLGNNSESFAEALLNLEDRRLSRFLELLEDYARSDAYIPKENIEPIITVLIDIGDLLPEGDLILSSTYAKLHRLFYKLIHRYESYDERFNIFKRAIEKSTKSLYTIVHEISLQKKPFGKYRSEGASVSKDEPTVKLEQFEELKKLACNKLESWAEDGKLAKHKYLAYILLELREWKQEGEVDKLVNDMIKIDEGLVDFITSFLTRVSPHNSSDSQEKRHWRIDGSIENFVDLKEIEPRIRKILTSPDFAQLDNQKKLAIETFLNGKIKDTF